MTNFAVATGDLSKRSRAMTPLHYNPLAGQETDPTLCSTLDVLLQQARNTAPAAWNSEGLKIGDIMYSLAPDSPEVLDFIAKWANVPSKVTKNKAMRCMLLMEFAARAAAGYLPVFKMPKERSTYTKVDAWTLAGIQAPDGASLRPFPWLEESTENLSGLFTQAIAAGLVHGKSAIGTDAVDKNGLVADGQRAVLSATSKHMASLHTPDGVVIVPIPRTLGLPKAMQDFLSYAKAFEESAKRRKKTETAEGMDLPECSHCGDATKQGRELKEQVLCAMCWEDGCRFNGALLEEHETCCEAAQPKSQKKHGDKRPAPEAPDVSQFVSTTAEMSPLCPGQRAPAGPLHADNVLSHKAAFALLDLAAGPTSLSSALRIWPGV